MTRGPRTHQLHHTGGNYQVSDWFYALRATFQANCLVRGHPMLRRPPPMTAPPKPQNARKYCEFHEQSGHAMIECRELKKALHELADKGQQFLRREQEPAQPQQDKECSTEVVAGGYAEGITQSTWKAQLRNTQQIKSKNLKVDFLVVDVPTAYNIILGRPTLHKYNPLKKKKRRGGGHIGLSTTLVLLLLRSPGLSIQGVGDLIPCVLTLGRRRDKLHLLRVTALIGRPLTLIHIVEAGLEIAILWKLIGQSWATSAPPSPVLPLTGAATLSSRLHWRPDQPAAFPNVAMTSPSNLRHSATALTPKAKTSTMALSFLEDPEALGVTNSQYLTKSWTSESLVAGSALMKLVDGRWVIGGEPPVA
ncbi:LOW QUALITY PROTEIN: hypothetical protein Cgig2_027360 [Carnegiea gigantea]|uniref:Uncharacterized protein n=1 Tax=Carnegiea gigantea TaxID=171969 RepID=A0A9Q1GFV3_9CARY|nr:LOW QUALITY PROTEIN: hypothetical protein Cgig2_027360 [Carnegiea gigantea]